MTDWIDAFCAACREWLERTGLSENYVTGPLMVYSGGFGKYQQAGRTASDPLGFFTVEQLRDWYIRLTDETGIMDIFLILASVKALDSIFESMVENYGGEMMHNRKERDEWQTMLAERSLDPEQADALRAMVADADRRGVGSLDDLKARREALVAWREIVAPIFSRTRFRYA